MSNAGDPLTYRPIFVNEANPRRKLRNIKLFLFYTCVDMKVNTINSWFYFYTKYEIWYNPPYLHIISNSKFTHPICPKINAEHVMIISLIAVIVIRCNAGKHKDWR